MLTGKAVDLSGVSQEAMTRSYGPLLFFLAAIWGASYLFIKVGVRDFEPSFFVTLRLLIGGALLFAFLAAREGGREALTSVRATWREGLILETINGALPFTLIAWGETHIDSGVAAIANASVPIFVALLAIRFSPGERSTGSKPAGIFIGLAGVGVLAGVHPNGGAWTVVGTLAVVLASFCYACGGLYGQRAVGHQPGPVLARSSMLYGALVLLPLALFQLPDHAPGWKAVASLLALAVGGTAIAQLVLLRMLRLFGAARVLLVNYLIPVTALVYGAAILDEPLRPSMLGGLGLILGGVALGSGVWGPIRRKAALESST
jgi:drug/metabolite transporter (DMT)-like permease